MRKLVTILSIAGVMIASCSKEQKAKKLIKQHLSETMTNFNSYQPVSFSKLDSNMSFFDQSINYSIEEWKTAKETFVPEFIGFVMLHTFRKENALGDTITNRQRFYFDKEITEITKTEIDSI